MPSCSGLLNPLRTGLIHNRRQVGNLPHTVRYNFDMFARLAIPLLMVLPAGFAQDPVAVNPEDWHLPSV